MDGEDRDAAIEVIGFAVELGIELSPWQQRVVEILYSARYRDALEVLRRNGFRRCDPIDQLPVFPIDHPAG